MPKIKMPRKATTAYFQGLGLDESATLDFEQVVAFIAQRDREITENSPCDINYEHDEGERMMDTD